MTSKIIKIRDILFYADTAEHLRETLELELALRHHNIGCYHRIDIVFNDCELLITNLRTATYGVDFQMYPDLSLPIVTWKEYYDDYERCVDIARTPDELQTSNLIANLHLVLSTPTS